jgi:hypothetical protein
MDTEWLMNAAAELEETNHPTSVLVTLTELAQEIQHHRDRALVEAINDESSSYVARVLDVTPQAISQQHASARRRLAEIDPDALSRGAR